MRISALFFGTLIVTSMFGGLVLGMTQELGEPKPWLHVEIANSDPGSENGGVNLPLGAVTAVLSMAPNTVVANGQLQVGPEHGVSVSALRDLWHELRDVGDTEFVTLQQGETNVRVARVGERVEVRVAEEAGTETVRADIPVAVLDALLSGVGETLNIDAAVETLGTLRGDIVHVTEKDRQIRVWVDESADQ